VNGDMWEWYSREEAINCLKAVYRYKGYRLSILDSKSTAKGSRRDWVKLGCSIKSCPFKLNISSAKKNFNKWRVTGESGVNLEHKCTPFLDHDLTANEWRRISDVPNEKLLVMIALFKAGASRQLVRRVIEKGASEEGPEHISGKI
jgi:hypothetical protein